jgi:hypothetical protein
MGIIVDIALTSVVDARLGKINVHNVAVDKETVSTEVSTC